MLFFHLDLAFQGPFCRCLIESGIEQGETDVTQREDAGNEKEPLTPTKKPLHVRRDDPLFSREFHGQ